MDKKKNLNLKRGQYVSRSVYAKVLEDNKRLKKDLRIISTSESAFERSEAISKWERKFKEDEKVGKLIQELLKPVEIGEVEIIQFSIELSMDQYIRGCT